jgi:hypothetical protein
MPYPLYQHSWKDKHTDADTAYLFDINSVYMYIVTQFVDLALCEEYKSLLGPQLYIQMSTGSQSSDSHFSCR